MGDPSAVRLALLLSAQLLCASDKVQLGRKLFFDTRLSTDGTVSCASCHQPEHGFADPRPVSLGVGGRPGLRNAPTVLNKDRQRRLFWDGRIESLEAQAIEPLLNPVEMGNRPGELEQRLSEIPSYRAEFQQVYGDETITLEKIAAALAAFERSLVRRDAAWDRWVAGNRSALSAEAEAGRELFFGRANCSQCHRGPDLGGMDFANISAGKNTDEGRRAVTLRSADWRLFQVPSLRDVERTAPYMHDGSLATLEDVVDFYDQGGVVMENKDYRIAKLNLRPAEKRQLIAFLKALTTSAGQEKVTPREQCFSLDFLPGAERPKAEELFLALLDSEALYTVAGIKPMSSGFVRLVQPALTPDREVLEKHRRWLGAFRCGEDLVAGLQHFRATYPNARTGIEERAYEAVLLHRPQVRETLNRHPAFFASLGLTAESDAFEVLFTVEYSERNPRWRGYGYLFGYPDYAVDFFVQAGIDQQLTGRFVERDFLGYPTFSRADRGVVYAIPKGAGRQQSDEQFGRELERVLEDYRKRREKFIGEAKGGVVELLRDWFCGGRGFCVTPYRTTGKN